MGKKKTPEPARESKTDALRTLGSVRLAFWPRFLDPQNPQEKVLQRQEDQEYSVAQ